MRQSGRLSLAFVTIRVTAVKRWTSIAVSLALGSGVGGACLLGVRPWLPTSPVVEGLRIEGVALEDAARVHDVLSELEERARARTIALRGAGESRTVTLAALGLRLDRGRTLAGLVEVGHSGPISVRLREARLARRGGISRPAHFVIDRARAVLEVGRLAEGFDRAAVDARMDLDAHERHPDIPGRAVDAAATVDAVLAELDALAAGRVDGVSLVSVPVPAAVTAADLADIDVSKVLAIYETRYSIHKVGRAKNVELAARRIEGFVLAPGGVMSFNESVGPRTREAGFHEAPEIVGDELTTGIGGGTCQVSSTLYAAALHAGLEIVERRSHSRPSDYTKLGLDATVKFPSVDLRLRNPYPYRIVVHSFMPKPGVLRVELLGGEEVDKAEYFYSVTNIVPYLRRITEKPFLPTGKMMMKQKGTRGMDVHSSFVIRYKDGRTEHRTFYSGYKATPEVFWVAPGFDRGSLPDLPEHARGVEGEVSIVDDAYSG